MDRLTGGVEGINHVRVCVCMKSNRMAGGATLLPRSLLTFLGEYDARGYIGDLLVLPVLCNR